MTTIWKLLVIRPGKPITCACYYYPVQANAARDVAKALCHDATVILEHSDVELPSELERAVQVAQSPREDLRNPSGRSTADLPSVPNGGDSGASIFDTEYSEPIAWVEFKSPPFKPFSQANIMYGPAMAGAQAHHIVDALRLLQRFDFSPGMPGPWVRWSDIEELIAATNGAR